MATRIDVLEETDSTQDVAKLRFTSDPLLVVTKHQLRGRGRTGHEWEPAPRAVAASLAFDPGWPRSAQPTLALVAGLAATDLVPARLKWPNDLVTERGKIGGILVESFSGGVVVGLGINLYWPNAPEGFAAVHGDDPGPDVVQELPVEWAERLLERAAGGPAAWGRDEYLARCRTVGRHITWEPDGAGTATGVSSDGGLVVETANGIEVLHSGAVAEIRPST